MTRRLNVSTYFRYIIVLGILSHVSSVSRATEIDPALEVGDKLSAQAQNFCANPAQYGYTRQASGKIEGSISSSKISRVIAGISGSAEVGGAATAYQGVAQDQLAGALRDRDKCINEALKTFREIYSDARKDLSRSVRDNRSNYEARSSKLHTVTQFSPVLKRANVNISFDGFQRNSFKEHYVLGYSPLTWHVIVKSDRSPQQADSDTDRLNLENPNLWFTNIQTNDDYWAVTLGSGIGRADAFRLQRFARTSLGLRDAYVYCWGPGPADPERQCKQ